MNYLPIKLLKLRKHYNYSQSYLADILGVDTITYMGYENGRAVMNYREMKKLASFYHINVADIFKNSEDVPLYNVSQAHTDEINIEYFLPKRNFFQKVGDYIKAHPIVIVSSIIILTLVLVIIFNGKKTPVNYVPVDMDTNKLSVSDTSVVYIDKNHGVKGSGDNSNGQLSNLPSENAIKVAEGASFTIVLKNDGTLESYGLMSKYEKEIKDWSNIVDVATGDGHVLACDNKGNVYCTGDNSYGQCKLDGISGVAKVYASSKGSVLVSSDGRIDYAGELFGSSMLKNYKGIKDVDFSDQILVILNGDGSAEYYSKGKNYLEVNRWANIVDVACGNDFIAALDSSGKVHISVDNYQIEDEVGKWENIIAIAAGEEYLIGFDGEKIHGVGKNSYHQFETGEILKQVLPQVSNVKVAYDKYSVYVQFDPVVNASGYSVVLNEGIGHSYIAENYETVKFDATSLVNDATYTITITALGEGDYENSQPLTVDFMYTIEEEKVEPIPEPVVKEDETFTIDTLLGKSKINFEAYLTGLGVSRDRLHPEESEELCSEGISEPVIISVEGLSENETVTINDLQNRDIKYTYCKVEAQDE